ncbi:Methyltransferase domain-containing protein [Clostridium cavendishii DSM 21758]|uniref:Methyltransferase domain-containing protein n=1 Tax=Clostridium cavendishii DSM 21758 TaxID=1121302 RepID=A0A1M6D5H5_9CLOT|nr:class I SAM-dependent methyltransferase [Clostridium cavendishii]SHI68515.1 Methyltransferase domain-containing protein [Clostridium cavendishii DSM 21758]
MLNYYYKNIFPFLINKNIGNKEIIELRRKALSCAKGEILEIGIGTGLNLDLYPDSVERITAIDNYVRILPKSKVKVDFYNMSADNIAFKENTFETVVSTFCLCSITNLEKSLQEIKRVLKPNGILIFLEHGRADIKSVQLLQEISNPIFNIFAGGCNVNRNHFEILENNRFKVEGNIKRVNIFPKSITGYVYMGVAVNEK